jgi:hypothetical protein
MLRPFTLQSMPAQIHVTFIDATTQTSLGTTSLPLEDLPDTFETSTTLGLHDKEFEVLRADPMTKPEFAKTGHLVLVLQEKVISNLSPKDLLYSLPTIESALPAVEEGSSLGDLVVLRLHEDDWRQIEVVSETHQSTVAFELAAINAIRAAAVPQGAFETIHVRSALQTPLSGLSMGTLVACLARVSLPRDGVVLTQGLVKGGFSAETVNHLWIYGQAKDDQVLCFCFSYTGEEPLEDVLPPDLKQLLKSHGLMVVDWIRGRAMKFNEDLSTHGF